VAVICGFGAGIGTSLATRLLAEGYRVAGLSRSSRSHDDSAARFMAIACAVGELLRRLGCQGPARVGL